MGLTLRTYRRWHRGGTLKADARRREHRPETRRYDPPNRLSPDERDLVLEVANAPRFASLSPHQIVAALADEGRYYASESTFYRPLRAEDQPDPAHPQLPAQTPPPSRGRPLAPTRSGPGTSPIWPPTCAGPSSTSPSSWTSTAARSSAGRSIPRSPPSTPPRSSSASACARLSGPPTWSCTRTTVSP